MTGHFDLRVYYEDTDAGGIVYYANYLRFIERARSEMLRQGGMDQTAILETEGVGFVVRRIEADYLAPARLNDVLSVQTDVEAAGRTSVTLRQTVRRGDADLFVALVVIVAVQLRGPRSGKPVRLPQAARALFSPA